MPWTIYRYILWELVKLLILTASVLVMVISFAAAIKPLSEGMLSATSLAKFVAYTSPTMLAFALPFAGAFASTIVFLRMASDNEFTAMSASGISYASILTPVVVLGVVLTMGLFLMSNFVIPHFYRAAAQTLERDLLSLVVSNLDGGRPFERDGFVLYADAAAQRPLTEAERAERQEEVPPSEVVMLRGVAVGQLDAAGRMRSDITAEQAAILVYRWQDQSWIRIALQQVMRFDDVRGELFQGGDVNLGPFDLPSPLREKPEFLSWDQLRRLREQPERFADVAQRKRALVDAVAAEALRRTLYESLQETAAESPSTGVVLEGQREGEIYLLHAPVVEREGDRLILHRSETSPVIVDVRWHGQSTRRFEAASGVVQVQRSEGAAEASIFIELGRTTVFLPGEAAATTEQPSLILPRARWPGVTEAVRQLDNTGSVQLLRITQSGGYLSSEAVLGAARDLAGRLRMLSHEIKAQLHQRAALAVGCTLLLLLGAVLSIRLRHQLPLAVYFWSFALAILTIVIVYTGTNLASSVKFPLAGGLAVLWMGNVLLAATIGVIYCKLART